MTLTYSDYANKTSSSKLLLCHISAKQRLSVFNLDSGSIYKKQVNYFVVNVSEDGSDLVNANNESLSSGEWYFNPETKELYINTSDDLDPKKHKIIVTYRFFFANMPIDLPYDLSTGSEVHYEGRLKSNSPIKKQLDDEQVGIVLESNTTVSLENTDSYFDSIFDVLIWENAQIKIYTWSEILSLSEKRKIFDGVILDKSFSSTKVLFKCKDSIFTLRTPIQSENFTSDDGTIKENFLYKPKRKIFGQLKQLQCTPIDSILDGFEIAGTHTVLGENLKSLLGVESNYLKQVSQGDELVFISGNTEYIGVVESVVDNFTLTFEDNFPLAIQNKNLIIRPKIPYRGKNRKWHIAGHKLRSPTTTITSVLQNNRFEVDDVSELFAGDVITVDGFTGTILRVSNNYIVLRSNLQGKKPQVGDVVKKEPVSKVYIDGREILINRDFTINNTNTEAIINLSELVEFNIAPVVDFQTELKFTQGSNIVEVTNGNPKTEISIRDWIQSSDDLNPNWYEVLQVTENEIEIRENYSTATVTGIGRYKNVNLINDNSVITVDCLGMERDGKWIKTVPDTVLELLETDAKLKNINYESFLDANNNAPYIASYAIPKKIGNTNDTISNSISELNLSIFGSLVIDNDYDLKYFALTSDRPNDLNEVNDDDLIDEPRIKTKNKIVRKVSAQYRFFSDKFNGEQSFSLYEYENQFVDDLIGVTTEDTIKIHLFRDYAVKEISERHSLYNSMSQSIITIKGKLNFALKELNSKIYLKLDRLYNRFGNGEKRKIGIINSVVNNDNTVTLEINDLGNSFNRVAVICDDNSSDYSSSNDSERIFNSYIVDDEILTPDANDDSQMYNNLIG